MAVDNVKEVFYGQQKYYEIKLGPDPDNYNGAWVIVDYDLPVMIAKLQEIQKKNILEGPPSSWKPMNDPKDLKHLLKLIEELGEAVSATARCLMQGMDEVEPVTKKPNRQWLWEELSDVAANMNLVVKRFALPLTDMFLRTEVKEKHLKKWHDTEQK